MCEVSHSADHRAKGGECRGAGLRKELALSTTLSSKTEPKESKNYKFDLGLSDHQRKYMQRWKDGDFFLMCKPVV